MSFLKKIGGSLLRSLKNGDLPVFLLFLLLASFFWWSSKMGDNFQAQLSYRVELTGLGDDVRVLSPVTSPVRVSMHGAGSALWRERRKERVITVPFDKFQTSSTGNSVLLSSELKQYLSDMLPYSILVDEIYPDTILCSAGRERKLRLPVRLEGQFSDGDRYIVDSLIICPDSVTVGVIGALADTLKYISTESLSLEADAAHAEFELNLEPQAGVYLYDKTVSLSVIASQYTEKSVNVPVVGINVPSGIMFRSFPARVRIMFLVRLSDFDTVGEDDFRVSVDCSRLDGSEERVEPTVTVMPDNVRNVRLQPATIEYMLEKDLEPVCSE